MRRTLVFQTWDPPEKKLISKKKKARFKIYIYMRRTQDPQEKRWYLETKKKKKSEILKINIWEELECLKLEKLKCEGW